MKQGIQSVAEPREPGFSEHHRRFLRKNITLRGKVLYLIQTVAITISYREDMRMEFRIRFIFVEHLTLENTQGAI